MTSPRSHWILAPLILVAIASVPMQAQELHWEAPTQIATGGARFVQAAAAADTAVLAWQVFGSEGSGGSVYLSLAATGDFRSYTRTDRFFGPIPYSDKEVPIFSLAVDAAGDIYLAVLTGETSVAVLASRDDGRTFRVLKEQRTPVTTVAPYLSVAGSGALLLFVTQTSGETSSVLQPVVLMVSRSVDGRTWSPFRPLASGASLGPTLKPHHATWDDVEYVAFQARDNDYELAYYHLYMTSSRDDGLSWGPTIPLRFVEFAAGELRDEADFDNQRPYLRPIGERMGIAWERRLESGPAQVYYTELDPGGLQVETELSSPASSGRYRSSNPQILLYREKPYLLWFDNRDQGGSVILAERGTLRWFETDLTRASGGTNLFGRSVLLEERLFVAWDSSRGETRTVQLLEPDRSVAAPVLRAVDFPAGRPSSRTRVSLRWSAADRSGVAGYSATWDRDPLGIPPAVRDLPATANTAVVTAEEDGLWYFHVRAVDVAGNWSEPATVAFVRDTTPPPPVRMVMPGPDARGYLRSNTYVAGWVPEGDEPIAGYSYSMDFLGPASQGRGAGTPLPPPPRRIMLTESSLRQTNQDNGLWALSVSAVDAAGNFSSPATAVFRLDKYVPVTFISNVAANVDQSGVASLDLFGRGFTEGGLVSRLFLDGDGTAPYDYVYDLEAGLYTVENDRLIETGDLFDLDPGTYHVGVVHPLRGVALAPNRVTFLDHGTVKIGDYTYTYLPAWELRRGGQVFVNASSLLVGLLVLFLALLAGVSVRRLGVLVGEGRVLRSQVMDIIEGRGATVKTQELLKVAEKRGMGLRLKFTLLMMILVTLIVLILAFPLGYTMIQTERGTRLRGLDSQIQLLTSSIAQAAEAPLRDALEGVGGLALSVDLPSQIDQMEEARYVLITGPGQDLDARETVDYVWGHKGEPPIESFLDPDADPTALGRVRVTEDSVQIAAGDLQRTVTGEAGAELSGLRGENAARRREIATAPPEEQEPIGKAIAQIERDIAARLLRYKTQKIVSVPHFDPAGRTIEDAYVFVKPIIYTEDSDQEYVRGYVRLGISTERIRQSIQDALGSLIRTTLVIALLALGLGVLGAIVLASMTVAPIKKLARGVAVIRDTADKEKLYDHRIEVRTRDEIGVLAQTVNEMTQGLAAAATASKDLVVGQETQKSFISLDVSADGRKGNVGGLRTKNLEVFGFYEGARTVSGDYFEYVKLDEQHYAIIKCDVAGKGVPAALVMVEVATLFSAFTRKWAQSQDKFRLDRFVYDVNDMLEVRGFKGRFAAFVVCILNVVTGTSYICNAGDKILHYFDAEEGKMKSLSLPASPAAGVFPSSLVELQTGYQQVKHQLRRGDVYVFHTDGVEEDHRTLRDMDGNVRGYDEPDYEAERRHSFAPKKGEESEMIETERLFGVLEAALTRSTYVMTKFYNPTPEEVFTFDFHSGSGSLREAVYAVIGLDRMFRVYRDSTTDENSQIQMDRNVLEFLRKHYVEFDRYFTHPLDDDGKAPQIAYTHLAEDEQFDDLTILMVKRT
jgi:HAMP domain-containing protein